MKLKSILVSTPNIFFLVIALAFIVFSSLTICVNCIPRPDSDCGYCGGCHKQIDCWTKGLIKSPIILAAMILVLYLIFILVVYLRKK
jgi:hypothetical protein